MQETKITKHKTTTNLFTNQRALRPAEFSGNSQWNAKLI